MVKLSHIYSIIPILLVSGFSFADTHYVSLDGTNDTTGGYTTWSGAATQIQWAVTKAVANDKVMVSNGTYTLTNMIDISKDITLKSLNGRDVTFINGNYSNTTNRCIYAYSATVGAIVIDGFTITNGFAHTDTYGADVGGGGIHSYNVCVINCTIALNQSHLNSGWCLSGGGLFLPYGCSVSNCIISNNVAVGSGRGGGVTGGSVYNSMIINNSASFRGGGAYQTTLYNCTVVSNTTGSGTGGGAYGCTRINSISWGNNMVDDSGSESYSCGVGYTGVGSTTNDPLFIGGGNYRLRGNSPCFNTGTNQSWMTGAFDLDGKQRIRYGRVDMGAYERIYEGSIYKFH